MVTKIKNFSSLFLGETDANTEADRYLAQFLESFIDRKDVVETIRNRHAFLILGPKGAGKTAVARYLESIPLDANGYHTTVAVKDIPFGDIPSITTTAVKAEDYDKSVQVWTFLLQSALLESALNNENLDLKDDDEANLLYSAIAGEGFTPSNFDSAVRAAAKRTVKFNIRQVDSIRTRYDKDKIFISEINRELRSVLSRFQIEDNNKCFNIILDELDSIHINNSKYIDSISGLVQAAYDLNRHFWSIKTKSIFGVILLLRTDIFNRINLPDSQKIFDDWSVELNWTSNNSRTLENSPLFDLVDKKTGITNMINEYFPNQIHYSSNGREEAHRFLLAQTRHTPRDILALLKHIQSAVKNNNGDSPLPLKSEVILEGINDYAENYFIGAIENELIGVGFHSDIRGILISSLKNMRKRKFEFQHFKESWESATTNVTTELPSVEKALKMLFDAGAIGNFMPTQERSHIQFSYRRSKLGLHTEGTMVLHNSLTRGWNIPWE